VSGKNQVVGGLCRSVTIGYEPVKDRDTVRAIIAQLVRWLKSFLSYLEKSSFLVFCHGLETGLRRLCTRFYADIAPTAKMDRCLRRCFA
jgi:hypothetical protein